MKLSTRSRYGLRMMYELALHYGSEPVILKNISVNQDISEKYVGKGAKAVLIAKKDEYQIEFFVTENKDYAVGSYNLNKEKFEKTKGNNMIETQKSIGNVSKYTLKSNSTYKVVSRIGDTFIYVNAPGAKTEEINEVLKKLGY